MSTEGPGQLGQLWAWATGAVGLVAAWLWNHTMGRLQTLERTKVDQKDFDMHVVRSDKARDELREGVVKLFEGQGDVKQSLARIEGKLDK